MRVLLLIVPILFAMYDLLSGATLVYGDRDPIIRCLTMNIRYDNPNDGVHAWPQRRDRVFALIRSFDPDLIALQEVLPGQYQTVKNAFDNYGMFGVGRSDGGQQGEASPLLWRKDRYEKLDAGTWWLSDTPDEPSRGWDAALPRIATWVRLRDRSSEMTLLAVSTHFDHRGSEARDQSARLLAKLLKQEERVVLMGDFNATPRDTPHQILTDVLHDTAPDNAAATWTGWDGEPDPGRRIDWILTRGFQTSAFRVHRWANPERPESDHLPVYAELSPATLTPH